MTEQRVSSVHNPDGGNLRIRPYQPADEEAVVSLWYACGLIRPAIDPRKEIQRKVQVQPDLLLVGVVDGEIVATVMAGYEGHRGWLNFVAVNPKLQRMGLGRAMVAEAERLLRAAGAPKINLQVRTSNASVIEFYRRLGYVPDEVVSLGKRLAHDNVPG
jgi:ribosomal protein S18 acetylase RimI-like enzyme